MSTFLWIGSIVAGTGVVAAVWRLVRKLASVLRSLVHFVDEWFGEPARPGMPERPGVIARLHSLDTRLYALETEMTRAKWYGAPWERGTDR